VGNGLSTAAARAASSAAVGAVGLADHTAGTLVGASAAAPRALRAAARSTAGVPAQLAALVQPGRLRHQRRVTVNGPHVHVELRGAEGKCAEALIAALAHVLDERQGVGWWQVNLAAARVVVETVGDAPSVAEVIALIEDAEDEAGTSSDDWDRHHEHPADVEPLVTAGLALAADVVGLVAAAAASRLRLGRLPATVAAGVTLVDAQPRARRLLEARLGPDRTDLLLAGANAGVQAVNRGGLALLVDAVQRAEALAEVQSRRVAWGRWEALVHGPGSAHVVPAVDVAERPRPLPPGPVERVADQAAAGSLVGAAAVLLTQRSAEQAAAAVLVGVPKASRLARESFASTIGTLLTARGVLPLDRSTWRRFDRLDTVVVDGAVLQGQRPLVLAAQGQAAGWSDSRCWSAGQRLLTGASPAPAEHPALGSAASPDALRLVDGGGGPDARARSDARWHDLTSGGRHVGRVLIGVELHPLADPVLASARAAGLRVVLVGGAGTGELRGRADEVVAPSVPLVDVVRRLQVAGAGVAVVTTHDAAALAAADVGIGVLDATHRRDASAHGVLAPPLLPWTADLVCAELAVVPVLLAATATARAVSERGRVLAISASTLGALLIVAGPRRGSRLRAVSPVAGAALVAVATGTLAGWRAARRAALPPVHLVPWHNLSPQDVLDRLDPPEHEASVGAVAPPRGGSPASRLVGGPTRAAARTTAQLWHHVREELEDPLTPVLSVGAAASAVLGSPTDAVLVGSVMGVNAMVSALQRQRAEQAMRGLLAGESLHGVRLDGPAARDVTTEDDDLVAYETRVPAATLVAGDVIALRAGDVVPADGRLITAEGLEVDESGLTGESVTVDKQVDATPGAVLAERTCMVFEGGVVVAGTGRAVVTAVGSATQAGRAAAAVPAHGAAVGVQAHLRALTDKALPLTLVGGAGVTALGMLRGQLLRAAVADGVAVAVAAVPEGLPLVATVAQLAAARRLSRRGVLVRSSRTVEALGRVDTVCFDKTGTLTEGRLGLVALADLDSDWTARSAEQAPDARRLLRAAARACPQPGEAPIVHATDRAIIDAAQRHLGLQAAHVWDFVDEVPFQSYRGYSATLGHTKRTLRLVVKGSPEVLIARCTQALRGPQGGAGHQAVPFTAAERALAEKTVERLARQGLRVLAVARRDLRRAPDDVETAVEGLTLLGFVGLADAPREATMPVVQELQRNAIHVVMITGDHPVTAAAVARALGIGADTVVTGAELDALDETASRELIASASVFARVSPEQKVRVVAALQAVGRVVAMTGDGSNDAAAIQLADVGIGLAAHGSTAARNAADLVLTDPDLTLLLDALTEGRAMWQRVRDAVSVLVGGNAGEVVFTLVGTAIAGRAPVRTRQLLLVNLLTDMFPAMAVALATARPTPPTATDDDGRSPVELRARRAGDELARSPRPELGSELLRAVALRGAATAGGATAAWLLTRVGPRDRASTTGLVALVGAQLGQTVVVGARSPLVWATALGSGAVLATIVQTPVLSQFFGCTPLDPLAWGAALGCAAAATAAAALAPALLERVLPTTADRT